MWCLEHLPEESCGSGLSADPGKCPGVRWNLDGIWVSWRVIESPRGEDIPLRDLVLGDTCRLVFCRGGEVRACPLCGPEQGGIAVSPGCCGLLQHPRGCRCTACALREALFFELQIGRQGLIRLLEGLGDDRDPAFRLESLVPDESVVKTTPQMDCVLRTIQDHVLPCEGRCGDLFVLARILELVWLFFREVGRSPKDDVLETDRRAVLDAQNILEENLETPPSLPELAAEVGMSLTKFKKVFSLVSGMPAFSYLRKARMERAMYLIRKNEMNITEVAYEVGYSSLSQFSRAFGEHFGIRPSQARHGGPRYME
jgi:AraC-like DNA-binding protein